MTESSFAEVHEKAQAMRKRMTQQSTELAIEKNRRAPELSLRTVRLPYERANIRSPGRTRNERRQAR
jgi:hypothetical protein